MNHDCGTSKAYPFGLPADLEHARRAALAAKANDGEDTIRHRPRLPEISADSTREELIAWLCANDRNGCYSDADCTAEGWDLTTVCGAWALIDLCLEHPLIDICLEGC